jgi:hypothetical protein
METESDSQNVAVARAEQHLRRMKRYRTLVFVAAAGFICYGLLPRMGHVTRSARKTADLVGAAASAPAMKIDQLELSAFQLGKSVSDYSAMRLLNEKYRPGQVHAGDLTSARAEIETRLSALHIAVDPDALEFSWRPGDFDSPASGLLTDALARKYGQRIRAAYLLGVRLMSTRWRAARLRDTMVWESSSSTPAGISDPASKNSPAAILSTLEAMASQVIGSVDLDEFSPPAAVGDLIRSENSAADSLLLQLFSLDMAVETRLSH